MKSNPKKLNRTLYFIVLALLGVFYLLANFPKEFSRLWGMVVLVIALAGLCRSFGGGLLGSIFADSQYKMTFINLEESFLWANFSARTVFAA